MGLPLSSARANIVEPLPKGSRETASIALWYSLGFRTKPGIHRLSAATGSTLSRQNQFTGPLWMTRTPLKSVPSQPRKGRRQLQKEVRARWDSAWDKESQTKRVRQLSGWIDDHIYKLPEQQRPAPLTIVAEISVYTLHGLKAKGQTMTW